MKVQQITSNYNQNKISPNFSAGKIVIKEPNKFLSTELSAIAHNDEFKKLADIAETKGSDLTIKLGRLHESAKLIYHDTIFNITSSGYALSKCLENFTVDYMMQKLDKMSDKKLYDNIMRKEALKLIDEFNKTKDKK